jgi:hypothetical protein
LKQNYFKIGCKGYQKKRNYALISKYVEILRQEVPKDFFSEKRFFAKVLKIQFFCKTFFPFAKLKTFAHF